jgi:hypothetical protein
MKEEIPLSIYACGRNPYPSITISAIARAFIDNTPEWEDAIIGWLKQAEERGNFNPETLEYKSIKFSEWDESETL